MIYITEIQQFVYNKKVIDNNYKRIMCSISLIDSLQEKGVKRENITLKDIEKELAIYLLQQ